MPIPTDVTLADSFDVIEKHDVAPPGTNFAAYVESGVEQLSLGQQVHSVTFVTEKAGLGYVFDEFIIYNHVDASPITLGYIETAKSTTGFQLTTTAQPDTGNYFLRWKVRIPTTLVDGAVTATTTANGSVTEVSAVGTNGIHATVSNATTAPTVNISINDGGIPLAKLAEDVMVDDGTIPTLSNPVTLTNKTMDGNNNTFQNIPFSALANTSGVLIDELSDPGSNQMLMWDSSAGAFHFMGSPAVRGISTQVWISARTDGVSGTGTAEDPYDGSTKTKFEAILASNTKCPTNTTIHLGPGTFLVSEHDTVITNAKSGWTIIGAGMYATTIQLNQDMSAITYTVAAITGTVNNFTIKDLTVDANYSGIQASMQTANAEKFCALEGIGIAGSHNTIERVRVINTYGSSANDREHFAISIGSPTATATTGNTIRFCRAESPNGTYGNPFALFGADNTHLMTDSTVEWNTAVGISSSTSSGFNTGGVNCGWLKNCAISHNTFRDCSGAFYCDTGSLEKITIDHNKVDMGWAGIMLVAVESLGGGGWTKKNIQITNNELTIQNRVVGGGSYGIKVSGDAPTNVHIAGHKQKHDATGGGLAQIWHLFLQGLTNSVVEDNTSDDNGSGFNDTPTNVRSRNNKTWAGVTLSVSAGSGTFSDNETDPNAAYQNAANTFSAYQIINTVQVRDSLDSYGQVAIRDTTAYNASPRSGIVFQNKYTSGGALAGMGGLVVGKENATDGNYASYLSLVTRPAGGSSTEALHIASTGAVSVPLGLTVTGQTITDGTDVVTGTTNGSKIGGSASAKLSLYNATPIVQRSGAAQAAVITTAATNTTPYGFATQAQADAIVTLVNELRAAAVAIGMIKGSA